MGLMWEGSSWPIRRHPASKYVHHHGADASQDLINADLGCQSISESNLPLHLHPKARLSVFRRRLGRQELPIRPAGCRCNLTTCPSALSFPSRRGSKGRPFRIFSSHLFLQVIRSTSLDPMVPTRNHLSANLFLAPDRHGTSPHMHG